MTTDPSNFRIQLRPKTSTALLLLALSLAFVILPFLTHAWLQDAPFLVLLSIRFVLPVLGLLFLYQFVVQIILKRLYVQVDSQGIEVRHLFGVKRLAWGSVVDISTFSMNHHEFLGFTTRAKPKPQSMGGFWRTMAASAGGNYATTVALRQLYGVDREATVRQIRALWKARWEQIAQQGVEVERESEPEPIIVDDSSVPVQWAKALGLSALIAVGSGVGYGVSLHALKWNILILPLLGVGAAYFYYQRRKPVSPWVDRCWMAALGVLVVLVARMSQVFCAFGEFPTWGLVMEFMQWYQQRLVANPMSEFVFLLMAVVCSGFGFYMAAPTVPWFRKVSQTLASPFTKRYGLLTYKRKEAYLTIYLVPEGDCDPEAKWLRVSEGCEIETEKAALKYFRFPLRVMTENAITYPHEHLSSSDDGVFLELPFGGGGNTRPYAYDAFFQVNDKQELIAIQLEIHGD